MSHPFSYAQEIEKLRSMISSLERRLVPDLAFRRVAIETPVADQAYPDQNLRHIRFFRVRWPVEAGPGSIDFDYWNTKIGNLEDGPPIEGIRPFYYDPNVGKWLSFDTFEASFGGGQSSSAIAFGVRLQYLGAPASFLSAADSLAYRFWSVPDDGYLIGARHAFASSGAGAPTNAAAAIRVNDVIRRRSPFRDGAGSLEWYRGADGTFYVPVGALDAVSVSLELFDPGAAGTLTISSIGVSVYFKMARQRDDEEFEHVDIPA